MNDARLRPPVDQAARERVVSRVDRSMCVEAAAGTGKTTLLVDRILRLIEEGRLRAPQLAAITFTELAAAELKSRVRDRLAASAHPAHREALGEIEAARICTIHSLALALLRERPVEVGLDPGFETVDASQAGELFDELWRAWLGAQAGGEAEPGPGEEALRLALEAGLRIEHLREAARALYDQRDVALDDEGMAARAEEAAARARALVDAAAAALEENVPALRELVARACLDPGDRLAAAVRSLVAAVEGGPPSRDGWEGVGAALRWVRRVMRGAPGARRDSFAGTGARSRWRTAEALDEARQRLGSVAAALSELERAAGQAVAARLAAWLREFVEWAQKEKKRRGVAEFLDQLLWCRDLLRDHPSARRHFQRRFRAVLVDEFQDTDPLQAEIVFFLGEQTPDASDWKGVRLGPGRLFVVGDPKQSIYRFRRADVDMYAQAAAVLQAQGGQEAICQNFRTIRAITQAVNECFARWMAPPDQPRYVPLDAYRPDPPPGVAEVQPGAYRLELPGPAAQAGAAGGERLPTQELRRAEAAAVAAALARLVGRGLLRVEDGGRWRPAGWRDAVVLLPTFTGIEVFEEALHEAGVPFRVVGGRLFYYRPEIRELALVLSAVHDPCDQVAVLGAVRSGFFGVSDEELWRFASRGGRLDASAPPPPEAAAAAPRLARALEQLGRWHRRCTGARPVQALRHVLEESGYLAYLRLERDGARALANVDKLLAQAAAMEAAGPVSFGAFVQWLARRGPAGSAPAEEEDSPLAADEDVVRVMTVHRAKGLEFPVVFVANLGQARNDPGPAVVDRAAGRVELRFGSGEVRLETPGFSRAAEQERRRLAAERVRLYYVALTRARDYLFVSGAPYEGGFWEELEKTAGPDAVRCMPSLSLDAEPARSEAATAADRTGAVVDAFDGGGGDDPTSAVTAWEARRRELLASAGAGLEVVPARTAAREAQAGPSEPAGADETGEHGEEHGETGEATGEAPGPEYDGTRVGLAFHRLMEQVAAWRFRLDEGRLQRWADALARSLRLAPEERQDVASWARRACGGPLGERARAARRCLAEVPFVYRAGERLVEGRIDLVLEEGDGRWSVVDYKTDAASPAELAAAYGAQVRAYAQALAGAVPGARVDAYVYAARHDRLVPALDEKCRPVTEGEGDPRPGAE